VKVQPLKQRISRGEFMQINFTSFHHLSTLALISISPFQILRDIIHLSLMLGIIHVKVLLNEFISLTNDLSFIHWTHSFHFKLTTKYLFKLLPTALVLQPLDVIDDWFKLR